LYRKKTKKMMESSIPKK